MREDRPYFSYLCIYGCQDQQGSIISDISMNVQEMIAFVVQKLQSADTSILLAGTSLLFLLLLYFFLKSYNNKALRNGDVAKGIMKLAGWEAFGKYMDIFGSMKSLTMGGGIMEMAYVVPEHLCHAHADKTPYLDLAAILALTDEITTALIACNDKTLRPGVSVSLSGELYCDDIRAGQQILIETCVTKIGATLGFTEVAISC